MRPHDHTMSGLPDHEHSPRADACSLFGCGQIESNVRTGDPLHEHLVTTREADRLQHMEEVDQQTLGAFMDARGRERRGVLRAGGFLGAMAVVGPLFSRVDPVRPALLRETSGAASETTGRVKSKVHVVEPNAQNTRLGVIDATLPNIFEVDSGDTILYRNTWTHFLNKLQPGVPIEALAQMRKDNPGKGPHSIIGPVGVRGSEPGDVLEVHFQRLRPVGWGVTFNNPGALGTGAVPDVFPEGQVKYFDLDLKAMTVRFNADIQLNLAPFQGTFGVAHPDGFFGSTNGVVSSVPPGPHGGNLDLREQNEGSRLFLPVWRPGAKIYTGDSHALQGDGEVNLTAVETAMQSVRVQVFLHKQRNLSFPIAETSSHWIILGVDRDLDQAFRFCLLNAIDFLEKRAGLTRLDAYALLSIGASLRVTQVVDINKGVHCMIPKSIFDRRLRNQIHVV
jgi:acetamidase/formamidase